ncbi:TPA: hypothetical protein ACH3X1_011041 [Trebouxia sp. C0004]
MGISLPEVPVGRPVSQANIRQACTAQALQGVSLAAQALQGVSLAAQESLAGVTASGQQLQQPTAYNEQAEAHRCNKRPHSFCQQPWPLSAVSASLHCCKLGVRTTR